MVFSMARAGAGAGTVVVALLLVPASAGAGPAGQQVFEYDGSDGSDGAPQELVVPDEVCEVDITASGAQGGLPTGFSGLGGRATVTAEVTPGETLQVNVGGRGLAQQDAAGGAGGFNGGGAG
ncbi:hypothetical protein B7486_62810, partial [cyanobacterium TDX16]